MEYPTALTKPSLKDGDLVLLTFNNCEVSLRLPKIPRNKGNIDSIYPEVDFSREENIDWRTTENSSQFIQFSKQSWCIEHKETLDDIAICCLGSNIFSINACAEQGISMLDRDSFSGYILKDLEDNFRPSPSSSLDTHAENLSDYFNFEWLDKPIHSWIKANTPNSQSKIKNPVAYIPLGHTLIFEFWMSIDAIHYPNRENPFSTEQLERVQFKIMDEFLAQVSVNYLAS